MEMACAARAHASAFISQSARRMPYRGRRAQLLHGSYAHDLEDMGGLARQPLTEARPALRLRAVL